MQSTHEEQRLWHVRPPGGCRESSGGGHVWIPYQVPGGAIPTMKTLPNGLVERPHVAVQRRILPYHCPHDLRELLAQFGPAPEAQEGANRIVQVTEEALAREGKKVRISPGDCFLPILWLRHDDLGGWPIRWPTSAEDSFHFCIISKRLRRCFQQNGVCGVSYYPIVDILANGTFSSPKYDWSGESRTWLAETALNAEESRDDVLMLVKSSFARIVQRQSETCPHCDAFGVDLRNPPRFEDLRAAHSAMRRIPPWAIPATEIFWSPWYPDGFVCFDELRQMLVDEGCELELTPLEIGTV